MTRTVAAWATGFVLVLETFGIVLLCLTLGAVVDNQSMSLAGTDPDAVVTGSYVLAVVAGLFLCACAFVAFRCALRRHAPGRAGQVLLIVAAVVHGVLAAVSLALIGLAAFLGLLVVLALLVLILVSPDASPARPRAEVSPSTTP
ncbi:hypothetical protein [Streptomyces sp. NPDC088923]|uniref:hypothetical protein n=1 Tax=Streptomyces sp. NPDC088923 TaxID=3365913 RepID=UPI0037FA7471